MEREDLAVFCIWPGPFILVGAVVEGTWDVIEGMHASSWRTLL
jgi:hypothetical protein